MVGKNVKNSRQQGGKAITKRIRRAGFMVALALLTAVALAGAAWAANTIHCPGAGSGNLDGECGGTDRNDVMYGTKDKDEMWAERGADVMYGRGGSDSLTGDEGPDVAYGGRGNDYLAADCDVDSYCGEDKKHGGRGNDHIVGNLRSERHFGGRGDDSFLDVDSRKNPDVFRCGPGVDRVHFNKGLDKVAGDCEDLRPYNRY
jgi:Ca2+-binding RTX toxin-like protein